MKSKIVVETSILYEKIVKAGYENIRDSKEFMNVELKRCQNLKNKYDFVIYESILGELMGQIIRKHQDRDIYKLVDKALTVIISEIKAEIDRCDGDNISQIFQDVVKSEIKNGWGWSMDIYDIWNCSQALSDSSCTYLWTKDSRMLGSIPLNSNNGVQKKLVEEGIRKKPLRIVETLNGIR